MECSQNNVADDLSDLHGSSSELDIQLDDVNYNSRNEQDVLSNLVTAIEKSLSRLSVATAMSVQTIEQSLNAHADPPLQTQMSFSTASEVGEDSILDWNDDIFYAYNSTSPLQVWKDEKGRVNAFEMMVDNTKVRIVDSLECLRNSKPLEPVFFDPRIYLSVPFPVEDNLVDLILLPSESSDSIATAHLGPTEEEFEQWVLEQNM